MKLKKARGREDFKSDPVFVAALRKFLDLPPLSVDGCVRGQRVEHERSRTHVFQIPRRHWMLVEGGEMKLKEGE